PRFEFTPSVLNFGTAALGTNSPLTVTLKNIGGSRAMSLDLNLQGSGFSVSSDTCGLTLEVQESCDITYSFDPVANASYSAVVTVSASNGGTGTLVLRGTGGTGPG